jgi:macrodomain Ter protein organizer (MatP/YcbG family)
MAANERKRKNFLNAEAQRTRRGAKEFDLIFSANLCVLCVSALKTIPAK